MIERHWKGTTKFEEADHYIAHLKSDTFPKLALINGFIKASILRKNTETGIEFLIVTVWESLDSIKQFAGETPELAVVPVSVQDMMIDYDKKASHYEVAANYVKNMKRDN